MNKLLKNLILLLFVLTLTQKIHAQQDVKTLPLKYKPIEQTKWKMFSLYRVHIQDFAVTDKYNDTCNCIVDGKFLDKANANIGLSLYNNVSDKFAYSMDFTLGYGYASRKSSTPEQKEQSWLTTARADFYYHFLNKQVQLQPYLVGGMHASLRRADLLLTMPVGAGARYMFFNNQAMITAQVGYGLGLTNRIRNSVIYSSGLYVNLNKKYKPRELDLGTVADRPKTTSGSCANCADVVDSDCDGIVDAIDKCPLVPGLSTNNGCPISDRDGDGVIDQNDKCPDVAGPVSNEGCPIDPIADRDKDGIADNIDACPDQPGTLINNGCPSAIISDRDKDGILDNTDSCPDQAGPMSNNGCPVIVSNVYRGSDKDIAKQETPRGSKIVIGDTILSMIYFDFDKHRLNSKSLKVLSVALDYLKRDHDYSIELRGHTDLEGNKEYNEKLSENRVNVAKGYLLSHGIEGSRIKTSYFGKSKPAISSFDKNLARQNRRVEIMIIK